MFAESFTMFSFDCNSNNSTLESSLNEESNDSSDDFSANELSTSKKNGSEQCFMSRWLQERRLNKVMWSIEKYPRNKLKLSITENTIQFFILSLGDPVRLRGQWNLWTNLLCSLIVKVLTSDFSIGTTWPCWEKSCRDWRTAGRRQVRLAPYLEDLLTVSEELLAEDVSCQFCTMSGRTIGRKKVTFISGLEELLAEDDYGEDV